MLKTQHFKALRTLVIINLALLALLLIFGLAFDTQGLANPAGFSAGAFVGELNQAGISSYIHMTLGLFVGLLALINMVVSLRSGVPRVQATGTLAFLAILFAGIAGLFFVFTGFQYTGLLLALVPLFALSVISFILELIFLRTPLPSSAG